MSRIPIPGAIWAARSKKGIKYAVTCAKARSYSAAASSLKVSSSGMSGSFFDCGLWRHRPPGWCYLVSPLGDKDYCVDLDACPKQKASDLDCCRCRWIIREDLAADLGEFGIGCKVREVDLDAHDLVHVSVELA